MLDFRKYENVPRFQLDRRPGRSRLKLTCPACGKSRCLTPYIDVATGQVVGNEFGRCDHERTCGYDKRPTGKDVGDKDLWISGNKCIRAYRPPVNPDVVNYIPFSEFERTVVPDDRNTVFRFLSSLWGKERVSDVFRRYHVGTMDLWGWKGCCIFWQIDKDFVCRTGKIMDFYIKTDSQGNDITPAKEEFLREGSRRVPAPSAEEDVGKDVQCTALISDLILTADELGHIKRMHWSIENRLHHVLDDTFREDRSPAKKSRNNLSLIRKYAYNILRLAMYETGLTNIITEMMDYFCDNAVLRERYVFQGIASLY